MKDKVLNLRAFNMITGINKSRTLIKHISRKLECMYDGRKYQLHQNWTNDRVSVSVKIYKSIVCDKGYFRNSVTCNCKNGKYVGSIIGDPVVICDEIINTLNSTSTKTVPAKCTFTNFYILLSFSIIDNC